MISTIDNQSKITRFEHIHDTYHRTFTFIYCFVVLSALIILTTVTIMGKRIDTDTLNRFWLGQTLKYITISLIQLTLGLLVKYKNLKVNYSRKIIHMGYFLIPQLLDTVLLNFNKTIYTEMWNIVIVLFLLIAMLEPIREKLWIFRISFLAVDRPEDQPYTSFWFISQLLVSLPIISGFSLFFNYVQHDNYVFIPILILTVGDGLAEPVGTAFGYHKYQTRGLFVDRKYTRSFEGSSCVFLSSIVSTVIYYNDFTKASICFTLSVLPIIMTITEAVCPHTWDNPILLLVGYIILVCANYLE